MGIPWDLLFELLFGLFDTCGDEATPEERVAMIQQRPLAVLFGVTRSLRKTGMRGRELRAARREVMEEIREASPEELTAFCTGGPAALQAFYEQGK